MLSIRRKLLARVFAFAVALSPLAALAQQTLPANSVWGRLGIGSGPPEAIPFASLATQLQGTFGPVAANKVNAGPTSGGAVLPTFRLLVGADLPTPGASSRGGVQSLTCSTHNWFNTLSTSGVFGCSQPSFSDLAGSLAAGSVTNAMHANMLANSVSCNPTNAAAAPQDCAIHSLHSKDFGATGNGSTDDTTNLQTWLTACQTRNIVCYLDAGTYKISSALSVTGAITLTGAGRNTSVFAPSNATQNTLTINTTAGYGLIEKIGNAPSVTKTAGAFINITSPSGNALFWTLRDLASGNDFDGITFGANAVFTVDNILETCTHICVQTGVTGDSSISNSIFQAIAINAEGIAIGLNGSSSANGSGMRFVNNKINSTFTGVIGIQLFGVAACASCSDLLIADNSIEVPLNGILLGPANSATSFANITITGNEINATTAINNTDTTTWLSGLTISGNTIIPSGGFGVNIQNVHFFNISGNVFTGTNAAQNGINISAQAVGCAIGMNQFASFSGANIVDASNTCGFNFVNAASTAIANNTQTNISAVTVGNGDWDISCTVSYAFAAAATFTQLFASVSLTSATLDQTIGNYGSLTLASQTPGVGALITEFSGVSRKSFATPTNVFCVGFWLGTGTVTTTGQIRATRVR